jgi:acyl dehydratase
MSDAAAVNPRGFFKRESKSSTLEPVTVQVERGRIRFFAQVLGETDPIHFDVEAARARGYPDLVAPPSFFMVIETMVSEEMKRRGATPLERVLGVDLRYVLHGDEHYAYKGLIFAGDTLTLTARIVDFYDKKGGALEFAVVETDVTHAERGLLIEARRTFVHRLPEAQP